MPRLAKSQILWGNFLTRSSSPPSQNSHSFFPPIPPRCGQSSRGREISGFLPQRGAFKLPTKGPNCQRRAAFSRPRLPLQLPPCPHLKFLPPLPSGPLPTGRSAKPGARPDGEGTRGHPWDPPQRPVAVCSHSPSGPGVSLPGSRGASPLPDHARSGAAREASCFQGAQRSPRPSAAAPLRGTAGPVTYLSVALAPCSGGQGGRDPRQRPRPATESPPPRAPRPKPRSHSAAGRRVPKKLRWPST